MRQEGRHSIMEKRNHGSSGGSRDTSTERRARRIDELLKDAELKARKMSSCGEPDDATYWKVVTDTWRTQNEMAANAALPMDLYRITRGADPFPKGTRYTLRKQGVPDNGEDMVDLEAAKTKASGMRKDRYDDFKRAEAYWVNRHEVFVSSLEGRAKDIYSGIFNDDDRMAAYDRRSGWQKTNYVYELIRSEIYSPEKRAAMLQRFHSMRQRPGQTNRAYIAALEDKRRELTAIRYNVTAEDFRHKILNSLNLVNTRHKGYFDARNKSLQEVKDFLYDLDDQATAQKRLAAEEPLAQQHRHKRPQFGQSDQDKRTVELTHAEWRALKGLRAQGDVTRKVQSDGIVCYYCKEAGHKATDCPKRTNKTDKRRDDKSSKPKTVGAIQEVIFRGPKDMSTDSESYCSLPSDIEDDTEVWTNPRVKK